MNNRSTITKFASIIVVIILVFFVYKFFFAAPSAPPAGLVGLAPVVVGGDAGNTPSDEFVALLSSLQAINLGDLPRVLSLLSNLEDFSTDLKPQTPGRANPFAPIGVGGSVAVEKPSATTTTIRATSTSKSN